jgi:hypothetical protein
MNLHMNVRTQPPTTTTTRGNLLLGLGKKLRITMDSPVLGLDDGAFGDEVTGQSSSTLWNVPRKSRLHTRVQPQALLYHHLQIRDPEELSVGKLGDIVVPQRLQGFEELGVDLRVLQDRVQQVCQSGGNGVGACFCQR